MSELKKIFVSESDLEARKQKRQEEWEKVRKPEDPLKAPEDEYDCRSLYERLKEQKDKQQAEYEETHKLKNMIRGLDDGEVEFLDLVDRTKVEIEAQRWKEDYHELRDFHKAVASLNEENMEQKRQAMKKAATENLLSPKEVKKSQQSLLSSVIKRKSSNNSEGSAEKLAKSSNAADVKDVKEEIVRTESASSNNSSTEDLPLPSVHCIGVLPGLGVYSDSSDSDDSDLDERTKFDLLGRPRLQQYD